MSYETAPATALVATACALCARPLVDAESVERGVGPDCARNYGYGTVTNSPDWPAVTAALGDEFEEIELWTMGALGEGQHVAHVMANRLVYRIAADQRGPRVVALSALGFGVLAARIAERLGAIRVSQEGDHYLVKSPYSEPFLAELRRVPGHRFDRAREVRVVPVTSRRPLWDAIRAAFPGTLVVNGHNRAVIA